MSPISKEAAAPPISSASRSANGASANPSVGMLRILLPTKATTDAEVINETTMVVTSIRNHPEVFETPSPDLKEIDIAIANMQKSIVPADMASNFTDRETARYRVALLTLFSQLAAYVLFVANGDPDIVNLSGFTLAKQGKRKPGKKTPEQASIKTVARGANPATLNIRMNGYRNASLFLVEIKTEDGEWKLADAFDSIFAIVEVGTTDKVTIRVWGKNGNIRSTTPSEEITV